MSWMGAGTGVRLVHMSLLVSCSMQRMLNVNLPQQTVTLENSACQSKHILCAYLPTYCLLGSFEHSPGRGLFGKPGACMTALGVFQPYCRSFGTPRTYRLETLRNCTLAPHSLLQNLDDLLVFEVFSEVCRAVAHMHAQSPPITHR